MEGIFTYIFDSMKNTDHAIKNIKKTLKQQKKINCNLVILAMSTTVYITLTERKIKDLTKKINKMEKELNNAKGE